MLGVIVTAALSEEVESADSLAILAWKSTSVTLLVPITSLPVGGVGVTLVFFWLTMSKTGAEVSTEGNRLQPVKVKVVKVRMVVEIIFAFT